MTQTEKKPFIHYEEGGFLNIGNAFIQFQEDWSQLLGGYNWYTAHLLNVYFEYDKMLSGLVLEVMILGLGFRFRWNLKPEVFEELEKRVEETKDATRINGDDYRTYERIKDQIEELEAEGKHYVIHYPDKSKDALQAEAPAE